MVKNVLLTGAGGPSAVAAMRALPGNEFRCFMADLDPHAPGLYLVPQDRRVLVPPGAHPEFVPFVQNLCVTKGIDVIIVTVDCELLPLAQRRREFLNGGTELLLPDAAIVELCRDKHHLLERARGVVPIPVSRVWDESVDVDDCVFPALVKPRDGSGSRDVQRLRAAAELLKVPRDGRFLLQEYLPGAEYSVDVVADRDGRVGSAVPRERLRIDSGVALTSRTVRDPTLEDYASRLAAHLSLRFVSNIQFRRDREGVPKLLEINPRVPGTLPLTVASGVNLVHYAVASALDLPLPTLANPFRELGMSRSYQEHFFPVSEFDNTEIKAWRRTG